MRLMKYLNESSSFTKNDEKVIYQTLKNFFNLPRRKFTGRGLEMELDDMKIDINSYIGILVIDSYKDIPNIDKLLKKLKEIFGDVHVRAKQYINARDFGEKYEEILNIKLPSPLKPIRKISDKDIKAIKSKSDASNMLNKISKSIKHRKINVIAKNINLELKVIKKTLFSSVVTYNNDLFVANLFDLYYSKDMKEAEEIMKQINLMTKLHRAIEVSSWKIDSMGPKHSLD